MKKPSIAALVVPLLCLLLSACAHPPEQMTQDVGNADQECDARSWPNAVTKVNCYDSQEAPIIQRDLPVVMPALESFMSKRRLLAGNFDNEVAPALEAEKESIQEAKEEEAILGAHVPDYGNPNSVLWKQLTAANMVAACPPPLSVKRIKCIHAIARPIWKRVAPDAVHYWDDFHNAQLQSAKKYESTGATRIFSQANTGWDDGIKRAGLEFVADARQAIQNDVDQNAADQARRREELAQFVQVLVGTAALVGEGYLAAEQARAEARAGINPYSSSTTIVIQNSPSQGQ